MIKKYKDTQHTHTFRIHDYLFLKKEKKTGQTQSTFIPNLCQKIIKSMCLLSLLEKSVD